MMRPVSLLVCLWMVWTGASAQEYPLYAGIRGGYTSGLSVQIFTDGNKATEAVLGWRDQGIHLSLLREKVFPFALRGNEHFLFTLGYGAHLGYEWRRDWHPSAELPSHFICSGPAIGLDAVVAAEYRFYRFPVSLVMSYMPFAEFSVTRFFRINLWDFGIGFRYGIGKKRGNTF